MSTIADASTDLAADTRSEVKVAFDNYVRKLKAGEMGSLPAVLSLLILGVLFTALSPYFLTKLNYANLFVQAAPLTVLAAALVFLIILSEIDLSAGVTGGVGMASLTILLRHDWPLVPALVVAFIVGAATGTIIGFIVARIGVPSFVVTLGFFLGYQGVQLLLLGDGGIFRVENSFLKWLMNENMAPIGGWIMLIVGVGVFLALNLYDRARRAAAGVANGPLLFVQMRVAAAIVFGGVSVWFMNLNRSQSVLPVRGVPVIIPIVLAMLAIGTFVLDRTRYGRHLYAVGGNPEAARRAGINVARIRISGFVICSSLAVFSGILQASRVGSVESSAGRSIVLNGVAAAVVGGVSLFGGRGRLSHAAFGALVIAMIDNGLGLLGLRAGISFMVTGGVLVVAASVDALASRRGSSVAR